MLLFLALAANATEGAVLAQRADRLLVETAGEVGLPGRVVGVYFADPRPDPRTGALSTGVRYAGDGRVTWVGPGMAEIALFHPDQVAAPGDRVVLDLAQDEEPTAAWEVPAPPTPPPDEAPNQVIRERRAVVRLRDLSPRPPQSVTLAGGSARDGFGTGVATARVAWETISERGPGRLSIAVDGIRGQRWVEPEGGTETPSTEIAAGYAVWTLLETPGARCAA